MTFQDTGQLNEIQILGSITKALSEESYHSSMDPPTLDLHIIL